MDSRRAQTCVSLPSVFLAICFLVYVKTLSNGEISLYSLEALAAYISQQKAIFERTQSTIDELRRLKGEAVAPAADVGGLAEQLSGSAFRLSEQAAECAPQVPESIDWTLFAEKDPKPLQALALSARTAYEARNKPGVTSRAPLSDLQKFVREAKQTMLDPVLALYADPPDEDEEMPEAHSVPASPSLARDHRKYTKNDKTDPCAASTTSRMPPRGPSGLFTRRKATTIDTAAMAVDLDASATMATRARRESMRRRASSVADPPPPPSDPAPESERSPSPPSPTSPDAAPDADADPAPDADAPPTPPTVLGKRTRRPSASANAKGKTDTYKVMWSAEEQNLLERLLEEIPADDPRRYLKISVAMEGRRTPRQVSSRVQKYLQKLKKYGVEGR
ncbi:hypothetical protein B0H13DRAFT_1641449 [Mycena leptocephala]|nr:hypothetical protein B0H13DRAFT_1641449 [Mycena leptocephala]